MADQSNMTRPAKSSGRGAGSMEGYTSGPDTTAPRGAGGRGSGGGDDPCVLPMGPMKATVIDSAIRQQSGEGTDWMCRPAAGAARRPKGGGSSASKSDTDD